MFYSTRVFFVISLIAGCVVSASVVPRTQVGRSESIALKGNNYNVEELPKFRSEDSRTYAILGGFRLDDGSEHSAIMKIIQRNQNSEADALEEIDRLKDVGLHLFTKIDDYAYFIVMRTEE